MDLRSKHLRRLVVRALEGGNRGHLGASMSLIEIFRVLYDDVVAVDPGYPDWPARDRVILSKGHGCLAQYVMLAEKGFFPLTWLDDFCRHESPLGGLGSAKVPGMEYGGGSLGHGLGVGVGMAMAHRMQRERAIKLKFLGHPHDDCISREKWPRVFVIMGDGECDEGSVWEAAAAAAKHKLSNIIAIIDQNGMQSAGSTAEVFGAHSPNSLAVKFRAHGWGAWHTDGHDVAELRHWLTGFDGRWRGPQALICQTIKGKGIPFAENNLEWHHRNYFLPQEILAMKEALA